MGELHGRSDSKRCTSYLESTSGLRWCCADERERTAANELMDLSPMMGCLAVHTCSNLSKQRQAVVTPPSAMVAGSRGGSWTAGAADCERRRGRKECGGSLLYRRNLFGIDVCPLNMPKS